MQIHKYDVTPQHEPNLVSMPLDAVPLGISEQQGYMHLWAMVDPEAEIKLQKVWVIGTGWDVPENTEYVHTFFGQNFVWHLFRDRKGK
jgi:hypothetical protein